MNTWELIIIAVSLAMDTFAVSIYLGIKMERKDLKNGWISSLYFGTFQALMPWIGFLLTSLFVEYVRKYNHWVAFILLLIIGGKMVIGSFEKKKCDDRVCPVDTCTDRKCPKEKELFSYHPRVLLPLAIATSIDAMAVGVTFAFMEVNLLTALLLIGIATFSISFIGVFIGNRFGDKLKTKAELLGGSILVLMGIKILLTGLGIISF